MNQCVIKQNKNNIATSGDSSLSGNIRFLSDAGSSACHRAHIKYWSDWADVQAQAALSSLCAFLLRLSREKSSLKLSYISKFAANRCNRAYIFGVNHYIRTANCANSHGRFSLLPTDVFFSYDHVHFISSFESGHDHCPEKAFWGYVRMCTTD